MKNKKNNLKIALIAVSNQEINFEQPILSDITEGIYSIISPEDTLVKIPISNNAHLNALQEKLSNVNLTLLLILNHKALELALNTIKTVNSPTLLMGLLEAKSFATCLKLRELSPKQIISVFNIENWDNRVAKWFKREYTIAKGTVKLKNQKIGVLGTPQFPITILKRKFSVKEIPIDELEVKTSGETKTKTTELLNTVRAYVDIDVQQVEKSIALAEAIREIISTHQIDHIMLNCEEIANRFSTTSCLTRALLAEEGIIVGCGETPLSMLSCVVFSSILENPPWSAEIASIDPAKNQILLAKCYIPLNLIGGISCAILQKDYDTGKGVAVTSDIKAKNLTLAKITEEGMLCTLAKIISSNMMLENTCRAQVLVRTEKSPLKLVSLNPGSPISIIPGKSTEEIKLLTSRLGIKQIDL